MADTIVKKQDTRTGKIYTGTEEDIWHQMERDGVFKLSPVAPSRPKDSLFAIDPSKKPGITGTEPKIFSQQEGTLPGIRPRTAVDALDEATWGPQIRRITRYFPEVMTALGGAAGGAAGGVPGSAMGSGIGSGIGLLAQKLIPEYFGKSDVSGPIDAAKRIGTDVGTDLLFSKAHKIFENIFPSILGPNIIKHEFEPTIRPDQLAALKADPNFKVSVGQVSEGARGFENEFAPSDKLKFIHGQQQDIAKWASNIRHNVPDIVETQQARAEPALAKKKSQVNLAYEQFEPHKAKNSKDVSVQVGEKYIIDPVTQQPVKVPIYKDEKIVGAVPLDKSEQFTNQVGQQLDQILGENAANISQVGAGTGYPLSRIQAELNKIRGVADHLDPTTKMNLGKRYASMDQLKAIRDEIGYFLGSDADKAVKDRLTGTLNALRNTINADIESGVKGWGKTPYTQYRLAQNKYKELALKFDNKTANQLLNSGMGEEATYMEVARRALRDPQRMQEFINTTGDRQMAKNLALSDMVDKSWDNVEDTFDPKKALQYLTDNRYVNEIAIPSQTRTNVDRFLRRAQLVEPFSSSGNSTLRWKVRGGVGLSAAALSYFGGSGNVPLAGAAGAASFLFAPAVAKQFAKRVLLNPKYARIATRLLSEDPRSAYAKWGTRTLLTLMKGAQIQMLTENNEPAGTGTVGEGGRVKLDFNEPSETKGGIDLNEPQ